jgi:hypothetical protein
MVPNKGLYLDSKEIDQPEGTWRDAKNLLLNEKAGAYSVEPGTDLTATNYPFATAKPIGTTSFPDGSYVIYSDGISGGRDRIGIVSSDGIYTDIVVDNIFNFSSNFPILASEFEYNYLNQRIISWTDNNNPPKILNIDFLPFLLNLDKSLVNPNDIKDILLFPSFKTPQITPSVLVGSGAVKAGGYSFCVAYENNDNTRTTNTTPQGIIHLTEDSGSIFNTYDGVEPGSITNKAIRVSLTNLDINYDKVILIGIQSIKGVITAFEIKKVSLLSSSMTIDYIGTENVINLDLEEILTPRPIYIKSKAMTQLKGELYHGNLETEEDIDYQPFANNIRIFYNTRLVSVNDLNTSHKTSKAPVGFAHGEVYAFYIHFILKNGSLSRGFHIPGRPIYGGESPNPLSTSAAGTSLPGAKVYQVEGTTNKGGHTYKAPDINNTIQVGSFASNTNMGFWQNENEFYPTGFPVLSGTPVRHHVFPTFTNCRERHYSSDPQYLKSKLDILGIDVTNVIVPTEIQNKIEGWVISYAKKDYSSRTHYGLDLMLFTARRSSGGDQEQRFDTFANGDIDWDNGGDGSLRMTSNYMRAHLVDLLIDKPQLSPNNLYVESEILYSANPNGPVVTETNGRLIGRVSIATSVNRNGLVVLYDYINAPIDTVGTIDSGNMRTTYTKFRSLVSDFRYIPNGVADGKLINTKAGEAVWLKSNNSIGFIPAPITSFVADWDFNQNPPDIDNGREDVYLYSLRQVRSNVHVSFFQQDLVLTDKINTIPGTSLFTVYGGDTFISNRTIMQMGANSYHVSDNLRRAMSIRHHITESRHNFGLRYEVPSLETTRYYPKSSPVSFVKRITSTDDDLTFDYGANTSDMSGYYKDYNLINIFNSAIIYEPSQITTNKFPNRVIKSGISGSNQLSLNSWKTYLSNDIYDNNRNRGEIFNLATLDDVLIIHHKYGLFRTVGKNKLSFDTTEVFLGAGDIFSQEPKEPIPSKLGYLGTQNVFSCINFKGGYAWWDQSQGRVFMLTSSGVIELSNLGLYNYFRDNSLISANYPDNPIISEGLLGTFDPKFNRLIFSKKSNTNPFTLSYSLTDRIWISFHDYAPDYYFSNNNTFFGFKDNKVHKFNSLTKKAKYLEGNINPFYISLVYNRDPNINKLYFNTNWISEVYDIDGNLNLHKTLTSIQAKTNYQDIGEIQLVPFTSYGINHNIRAERSTWHFNKLRDANSDVFKRKPLVGNYAIITYKFNNNPNLDFTQNLLYLYNISVKVRQSEL